MSQLCNNAASRAIRASATWHPDTSRATGAGSRLQLVGVADELEAAPSFDDRTEQSFTLHGAPDPDGVFALLLTRGTRAARIAQRLTTVVLQRLRDPAPAAPLEPEPHPPP